jgi:hypothetical protein
MTRTNHGSDFLFDGKIEKTTRCLRKQSRNKAQATGEGSSSAPTTELKAESVTEEEYDFSSEEIEPEVNMAAEVEERTLGQLAASPLNQSPLCITIPNIKVAFELKSGFI